MKSDLLRMKQFTQRLFHNVKTDAISDRSATFAYRALFALAPLLIVLVSVGSFFLERKEIQTQVVRYFNSIFGSLADSFFSTLFSNLLERNTGIIFTLIGLVLATYGVFVLLHNLRSTLFSIFDVQSKDVVTHTRGQIVVAFLHSVGIALILLVLILSTIATPFLLQFSNEFLFKEAFNETLLRVGSTVIFLGISSGLLALMYRLNSLETIGWKSAFVGGVVGGILLFVLNFLVGLYLDFSRTTTLYGASAFLVIFLLWLYYSSYVLFLGAEITKLVEYPGDVDN